MSSASPRPEGARPPAVSVLIPVYASGHLAAATCARVFAALAHIAPVELVLCDDGSPDDSLAVLRALRSPPGGEVRILSHANRGLSYTLRRLIREARAPRAVYLDMDLSFDVTRLPRLIELLGENDVVVASKYAGGAPCRVPRVRRACSLAFRTLVHALSGTRVKDIGSGMVAFRRASVAALGLSSEGFGIHAELFDRAHRAGLRVREEPVPYAHVPGSFDVLRHGWVAVRDFLAYRWSR